MDITTITFKIFLTTNAYLITRVFIIRLEYRRNLLIPSVKYLFVRSLFISPRSLITVSPTFTYGERNQFSVVSRVVVLVTRSLRRG